MQGSVTRHLRRAVPIYLVVAALVTLTALVSATFRSEQNFINVVGQVATLAAVAVGQTVVLLIGGIDLSIGSVVSLTTVILSFTGRNGSLPIGIAVPLALAAGLGVGLINGLGIVRLRISPLLMTLGTMAIVKGLALYLRAAPGGRVDYDFASFLNGRDGLLVRSGVLVLVVYLLTWALLHFTRWGRRIYAVGGNPENARRSGVDVGTVTVTAYMFSGLIGAVAGMVMAARIYSGDPVIGDNATLDSVAAAVLGGTSLAGGVGGVAGSLAGAVLLAISNNVLNLLKVYSYYQYVAKGLILAGALLFYHVRRGEDSDAI